MNTAVNTESSSSHIVWVGNATMHDAVEHVQEQIDNIGFLAACYEVIRPVCIRYCVSSRRYFKRYMPLYSQPDNERERPVADLQQCWEAATMDEMRENQPINMQTFSYEFATFDVGKNGRSIESRELSNSHWATAHYEELVENGLISDDRYDEYDPMLLLLHDRTTGNVLLLPDQSAIIINQWSSGWGMETSVVDGISLSELMGRYPTLFDDSPVDECDMMSEILALEEQLNRICGSLYDNNQKKEHK